MRNISFIHTKQQIYDGTKTETTRKGWNNLIPGMRLMAVEKGMGLKKGEKIKRIRIIEITKVEKINVHPIHYDSNNLLAEGFPDIDSTEFVFKILIMKCKCKFREPVNRITFKYI